MEYDCAAVYDEAVEPFGKQVLCGDWGVAAPMTGCLIHALTVPAGVFLKVARAARFARYNLAVADASDILDELVIDVPGVGATKFRDLSPADHICFHRAVVERIRADRTKSVVAHTTQQIGGRDAQYLRHSHERRD